jgi:hypothetical protein
MNKSEDFWNKASKNYDKTEKRFEYIHKKARENTQKHLKDSYIVMDMDAEPAQHPVSFPVR